MANTYQLIASNTLGTSATTVTFSTIPNLYTDLLVKFSVRSDESSPGSLMIYTFNGDTGSNYSTTAFLSNTGSIISNRTTSAANIRAGSQDGASATSNTFSNSEIYIPSYTAVQNKQTGNLSVSENRSSTAADAFIGANAGLYRVTTAITSITFSFINGNNFVANSTFWLYGIKNS